MADASKAQQAGFLVSADIRSSHKRQMPHVPQ
jgi:hypothetical protein